MWESKSKNDKENSRRRQLSEQQNEIIFIDEDEQTVKFDANNKGNDHIKETGKFTKLGISTFHSLNEIIKENVPVEKEKFNFTQEQKVFVPNSSKMLEETEMEQNCQTYLSHQNVNTGCKSRQNVCYFDYDGEINLAAFKSCEGYTTPNKQNSRYTTVNCNDRMNNCNCKNSSGSLAAKKCSSSSTICKSNNYDDNKENINKQGDDCHQLNDDKNTSGSSCSLRNNSECCIGRTHKNERNFNKNCIKTVYCNNYIYNSNNAENHHVNATNSDCYSKQMPTDSRYNYINTNYNGVDSNNKNNYFNENDKNANADINHIYAASSVNYANHYYFKKLRNNCNETDGNTQNYTSSSTPNGNLNNILNSDNRINNTMGYPLKNLVEKQRKKKCKTLYSSFSSFTPKQKITQVENKAEFCVQKFAFSSSETDKLPTIIGSNTSPSSSFFSLACPSSFPSDLTLEQSPPSSSLPLLSSIYYSSSSAVSSACFSLPFSTTCAINDEHTNACLDVNNYVTTPVRSFNNSVIINNEEDTFNTSSPVFSGISNLNKINKLSTAVSTPALSAFSSSDSSAPSCFLHSTCSSSPSISSSFSSTSSLVCVIESPALSVSRYISCSSQRQIKDDKKHTINKSKKKGRRRYLQNLTQRKSASFCEGGGMSSHFHEGEGDEASVKNLISSNFFQQISPRILWCILKYTNLTVMSLINSTFRRTILENRRSLQLRRSQYGGRRAYGCFDGHRAIQFVQLFSGLVWLDLSACDLLTSRDICALAGCKQISLLLGLKLKNCHADTHAILSLVQRVSGSIQVLDLMNCCHMSPHCLLPLKHASNLKYLGLGSSETIGTVMLKGFLSAACGAYEGKNKKQKINSNMIKSSENSGSKNPPIRALTVLCVTSTKDISPLLHLSATLEYLDIRGCRVSEGSARAVIPQLIFLKVLKISGTKMSSDATKCGNLLWMLLSNLKDLEKLELHNFSQVRPSLIERLSVKLKKLRFILLNKCAYRGEKENDFEGLNKPAVVSLNSSAAVIDTKEWDYIIEKCKETVLMNAV